MLEQARLAVCDQVTRHPGKRQTGSNGHTNHQFRTGMSAMKEEQGGFEIIKQGTVTQARGPEGFPKKVVL